MTSAGDKRSVSPEAIRLQLPSGGLGKLNRITLHGAHVQALLVVVIHLERTVARKRAVRLATYKGDTLFL